MECISSFYRRVRQPTHRVQVLATIMVTQELARRYPHARCRAAQVTRAIAHTEALRWAQGSPS